MTIGKENYNDYNCISGELKDWQFLLTSDLRGDLVENIVKSILPSHNLSTVLSERRRKALFQFAVNVEIEMYHKSDSKEEYLYLIAKKIQFIRREFEERKLLRKIDNLTNSIPRSTKQTAVNSSSSQRTTNYISPLLSVDIRQQMVKKILQVICPLQLKYDHRFYNLIKYVKKIEKEIYKISGSKEEYYHLIAEKVHKILIELNHKRTKRQQKDFSFNQSNVSGVSLASDQLDESNNQLDESNNQLDESNNQLDESNNQLNQLDNQLNNQLNGSNADRSNIHAIKKMFELSIKANQ